MVLSPHHALRSLHTSRAQSGPRTDISFPMWGLNPNTVWATYLAVWEGQTDRRTGFSAASLVSSSACPPPWVVLPWRETLKAKPAQNQCVLHGFHQRADPAAGGSPTPSCGPQGPGGGGGRRDTTLEDSHAKGSLWGRKGELNPGSLGLEAASAGAATGGTWAAPPHGPQFAMCREGGFTTVTPRAWGPTLLGWCHLGGGRGREGEGGRRRKRKEKKRRREEGRRTLK